MQQQQQQEGKTQQHASTPNETVVADTNKRKRKLAAEEDDSTTTQNNKNNKIMKNNAAKQAKQMKTDQPETNKPSCSSDDEDNEEDVRSETSSTCTTLAKKKKGSTKTSSAFNRLLEIEDKAPLCVLGETESNMFPRKLNFMGHLIDVIYDSRVHLWVKAKDFANALGYKNHKSAIERYVHPTFVRSFQEVLDLSRTRYGDAYCLYPVNSQKTLFLDMSGLVQLMIRSMISDENVDTAGGKKKQQQANRRQSNSADEEPEEYPSSRHGVTKKQATKPKLSADWINYQILPSLVTFSEATKTGVTAKEERRIQSQM